MAFDSLYNSVGLLLHGDGANNSTIFVDSGPVPKSVTGFGNAKISTAQSKFGGSSIYFDGNGDYLVVADGGEFNFAGDFTLEFWARFDLTAPIVFCNAASTTYLYSDALRINGVIVLQGLGLDGSATTWKHIAITREGTAIKLYQNGLLRTPSSGTGNVSGVANFTGLNIGRFVNTGASVVNGYFEDFRVTVGVARYTANFTPPTESFGDALPPPAIPARAQAATPLAAPALLAGVGPAVFAQAQVATLLGQAQVRADWFQGARLTAPGPLGAPSVMVAALVAAYAQVPGPIGTALVTAKLTPLALASAPSLLAACTALALHDFTGQLGDASIRYVMDLLTPSGPVRVPISSWQATLQTGSSNYTQCVIPACGRWVDTIKTATGFVIYRRAVLANGSALDYEMARAPAEQVAFDQSGQRHTCTLSGYSDAFAASLDPPAAYDRELTGLRTISSGSNAMRVRCAVDWLLRPGHRAFVQGVPFVVRYINYYAPTGFDSYMDVGA